MSAPNVTCIGELIVDFIATESGVNLSEAPGFKKYAGGAAANVAVGLAKLGVKSSFIGKVGDDSFGKFLANELRRHGVDASGIRFDREYKTRLAFVWLTKSGERSFEFWERHPADERLGKRDIVFSRIASSDIVHISSFLLISEPSRSTVLRLARKLHAKQCSVSFDPNIRLALWKSPAEAKRIALRMVSFTDILRLNEEESIFLTGEHNAERAGKKLLSRGPKLIVITKGEKGCEAFTERLHIASNGYPVVAVDTTGCGDALLAGLLFGIVHTSASVEHLLPAQLQSILMYANAVAALTATKHGVIAALPSPQEVRRLVMKKSSSRRMYDELP